MCCVEGDSGIQHTCGRISQRLLVKENTSQTEMYGKEG